MSNHLTKPNYGIDAPDIIRNFLLIGVIVAIAGGFVPSFTLFNTQISFIGIENTLRNVELEGVKDRVEIRTEDARHLSFADNSFDVILSLLCLHNIDNETEREVACREIARVLRPGGTAVLSDYTNTTEYAKALTQAGLRVEEPKSYLLAAYGLMWTVVATKSNQVIKTHFW